MGLNTKQLSQGTPDFGDAHWFPYDLDVSNRRFVMMRIEEAALSSSFLDNRIEASLDNLILVPASTVAAQAMPESVSGWLFHTSFCCSTLLARALHLPPYQVCLKEPLVLRRLGDARYENKPLADLVRPTTRLLMRPWHTGGAVIAKPTHAALNTGVDLLRETPSARAVILTSPLEDFLVSNIKKTPETQSKIPQLAERALRGGNFRSRLPAAAFNPPELLAVAALQWAAQRELVLDIRDQVGPDRVWLLDHRDLLSDVPGTTVRVAQWLGLPAPPEELARHAAVTAQRNAKAPEVDYSAAKRSAESQFVSGMFQAELKRVLAWAEKYLLPAMREAA